MYIVPSSSWSDSYVAVLTSDSWVLGSPGNTPVPVCMTSTGTPLVEIPGADQAVAQYRAACLRVHEGARPQRHAHHHAAGNTMADRQFYQDGERISTPQPSTSTFSSRLRPLLQQCRHDHGRGLEAGGHRLGGALGTGLYTVTFQDKWYSILGGTAGVYQVTYDKTHAGAFISTPATTLSSSVALQAISTDGNGTFVGRAHLGDDHVGHLQGGAHPG